MFDRTYNVSSSYNDKEFLYTAYSYENIYIQALSHFYVTIDLSSNTYTYGYTLYCIIKLYKQVICFRGRLST